MFLDALDHLEFFIQLNLLKSPFLVPLASWNILGVLNCWNFWFEILQLLSGRFTSFSCNTFLWLCLLERIFILLKQLGGLDVMLWIFVSIFNTGLSPLALFGQIPKERWWLRINTLWSLELWICIHCKVNEIFSQISSLVQWCTCWFLINYLITRGAVWLKMHNFCSFTLKNAVWSQLYIRSF